ncbi:DNA invertase Pin-like site-specific DNA recombinase [Cellulomonas uda]|uniref:Site-specific recombinase DNA invertase Pin n=1 Tax=Cellulomonas uda TaxID=1714 RepID=A0A4Y3K7F9_CELUD|nr:DNA invertase Pin-like site-specific DNA recombinase [Cellulomonas uda]GEA79867.1 site-specific recombinase DNA invertase Pin [Cellulomonas uda]
MDRQDERTRALLAARGWVDAGAYVDDDITASKPRGDGTAWAKLLADATAGKVDVVVAVDIDRLLRATRDLNTLIDHGLSVITVDGEIDLTTADGEFRATMFAALARFEVRRKGERQSRAQLQRAEKGRPPKGIRPTGYTLAGDVIEDEAAIVRRIFDRFTAGDTLKGIAADLSAEGVVTRRGGQWSSSSVASILRNARYAGRSIYKGQDVGTGTWLPLVSEAQFAAVQSRLDDPRRKTRGEDTARKHLGSGLYYCSCGLRVRSSSGMGNGLNRYTCRNACHYRSARPIDEYVVGVIRGRLAMPDLRGLLVAPADEAELAQLADEQKDLRLRLKKFEADYDDGLIDGRRLRSATEKTQARLQEVRSRQAQVMGNSAPDAVLSADNPVAAFDAAPLAIRRQVIDALVRVTLLPGRRGSRNLDPATVILDWRAG